MARPIVTDTHVLHVEGPRLTVLDLALGARTASVVLPGPGRAELSARLFAEDVVDALGDFAWLFACPEEHAASVVFGSN